LLTSPVKAQGSITINCSFENAKLTKIGHSLEEERKEILMEHVKINPSIKYKNCSHLDAVEIELITTLKQGEEKWNEFWNNQQVDLTKNETKQIKEYISLHLNNE
jgi:hypothetical protein